MADIYKLPYSGEDIAAKLSNIDTLANILQTEQQTRENADNNLNARLTALNNDTIKLVEQNLDDTEQAIARNNIGAAKVITNNTDKNILINSTWSPLHSSELDDNDLDTITVKNDKYDSNLTHIGIGPTNLATHTQKIGDVWYYGATIGCQFDNTDSVITKPRIQLYVDGHNSLGLLYGSLSVTPLSENLTDYFLTFKVTEDNQTNFTPYIRIKYNDATQVLGKEASFKNMILVNLTELFGKGNEPTAQEYYDLLQIKNNEIQNLQIDDNTIYLNKGYSSFYTCLKEATKKLDLADSIIFSKEEDVGYWGTDNTNVPRREGTNLGYSTFTTPVQAGEIYYISTQIHSNNQHYVAIFSYNNQINYGVQPDARYTKEIPLGSDYYPVVSQKVIIPEGVKFMRISLHQTIIDKKYFEIYKEEITDMNIPSKLIEIEGKIQKIIDHLGITI